MKADAAADLNQALIGRDEDRPRRSEEVWSKLWVETQKLWLIVGPTIFARVATFSMNIITQAFAGHLGDVELASISIANTVIVGFNFGLLVWNLEMIFCYLKWVFVCLFVCLFEYVCFENFQLGMASALETLCGQAYGAKRFHMLGIYLQRSWIMLFLCCFLLLPFYVYATPVLKMLGQADDVAELSGVVAIWLIPLHFSFAFQFPLQVFLQCQHKTLVIAWVSLVGLVVNVVTSWLFIYELQLGVIGAAIALDISWWVLGLGLYFYTVGGWCPLTWTGFSVKAFHGLWEFLKLSIAAGLMLW